MSWDLAWNVLSVVLGAASVVLSGRYPMIAIGLAFASGIIVALSSRFEVTMIKE